MTLFDRVFNGSDAVYGLTEGAIDAAIEKYGADKAVSFPNTAYSLPCYYAVTGTKVTNLGELKEALGVAKSLMTREKRLNDAFMSGVATALCAEFIEVLKYIDGAEPYSEPCYGHLADAVIRELGVPLVTGDIPGVAVILGKAPTADEAAELVKSYQAQGHPGDPGGRCDRPVCGEKREHGSRRPRDPAGQRRDSCDPCRICRGQGGPDLRQHRARRRSRPDEIHLRACAGICQCLRTVR